MDKKTIIEGLTKSNLTNTEKKRLEAKGIRFREYDWEISMVQNKANMKILEKYLKEKIRRRVEKMVEINYDKSKLYYNYKANKMPGNPIKTNWTKNNHLSSNQSDAFYEDFLDRDGFIKYQAAKDLIQERKDLLKELPKLQGNSSNPLIGINKSVEELTHAELAEMFESFRDEHPSDLWYRGSGNDDISYVGMDRFEYNIHPKHQVFIDFVRKWMDDYASGKITFDYDSQGKDIVGWRRDGSPITKEDFKNGNIM